VVVEERVLGAGVHGDRRVLAQVAELLLELGGELGREELVALGVLAPHRRRQRRPVGLRVRPRDQTVERGDRGDRVRALRGDHERQAAAHAEADDADVVAPGLLLQVLDATRHVLARLGHVHRHHQLARAVGLGRRLPVVQVRGERGEAGGGEAVDDLLDVRHEAPPLLDHEHAGPVGRGEVALARAAVAGEGDDLAHDRRR
jgi:hypothetical protein